MKVLVIGATGATGAELLPRLLAAGHTVTALVRSPYKILIQHEKLNIVPGEVQNHDAVDHVVKGQDAVLVAFGPRSLAKTNIQEVLMSNIVAAMTKHGVSRIVNLSAWGAGETYPYIKGIFKLMRNTILRHVMNDKEKGITILSASKLDFVQVCPGRLINEPARGNVKSSVDGKGIKPELTRADLADFMIAQLSSDIWLRKSPIVGY